MTAPPSKPATEAVLEAAARSLRPLVRLLLRHGITHPALSDMLRRLYVQVATEDVLTEPTARTDSRVSLLTGIHRKEVRRLRALSPDAAAPPPALSVSSQVVARWLGSAATTDAEGAPLTLPRSAPDGAASFDALVASVTTDVRPRAVLDDLIGHGIVSVEPGERVRLDAGAYLPRPQQAAQLFYFARNLHDHLAAAAANLGSADAAPYLDRSVHYDGLSQAATARLEQAGRRAAERLLLAFNRTALEASDADDAAAPADAPARTGRINLGVYLYVEPDAGPGGDTPA